MLAVRIQNIKIFLKDIATGDTQNKDILKINPKKSCLGKGKRRRNSQCLPVYNHSQNSNEADGQSSQNISSSNTKVTQTATKSKDTVSETNMKLQIKRQ